jgi:hypothetical protein
VNDEIKRLLELAAKAIGLELKPMEVKNVTFKGDDKFIGYMTDPEKWPSGWFCPHKDDGDSRRLEVALRMDVGQGYEMAFATATVPTAEVPEGEFAPCIHAEADEEYSAHGGEALTATRMAVLRCAASIGEQMQEGGAA